MIERKIILAQRKREVKAAFGDQCCYCCRDFSEELGSLTIHHVDYLGYSRASKRDPFDIKIAKTACKKCHLSIHITASIITLGLIKAIPIRIILKVIEEAGIERNLAQEIVYELKKVGINELEIGFVSDLVTRRILKHALIDEYYADMEIMLDNAAKLRFSPLE